MEKEEILSLLEVSYWEFHDLYSKSSSVFETERFSTVFHSVEEVIELLTCICAYCKETYTLFLTTDYKKDPKEEANSIQWSLLTCLERDLKLLSFADCKKLQQLYKGNPRLNLIRFCKSCAITNRILPL